MPCPGVFNAVIQGAVVDVTPEQEALPEPTTEETPAVDPETGEVKETHGDNPSPQAEAKEGALI